MRRYKDFFDWSDYLQADILTTTEKKQAKHAGATYNNGGEFLTTIKNGQQLTVLSLVYPIRKNYKEEDVPQTEKIIF